jgi:hypothetical protein
MADERPKTSAKRAAEAERKRKLAQEMRRNLLERKAQQRARAAAEKSAATPRAPGVEPDAEID